MIIVITMAGAGKRFADAGYKVPKYQIEAKGKTLFEWSMISLDSFYKADNRYIFIVRQEDDAQDFIQHQCEKIGLLNYHIVELDGITDGQATTAMQAREYWEPQGELLIYNIDTFVEQGEMQPSPLPVDGFIPCFHADGGHWSFVKTDESGLAVEVREKQRISDNCTLGAYYFKSCDLFESLYYEHFRDNQMEKGEKYVAPLYNTLIQKGGQVRISIVDSGKVHVLGTPEELKAFENSCGNV